MVSSPHWQQPSIKLRQQKTESQKINAASTIYLKQIFQFVEERFLLRRGFKII